MRRLVFLVALLALVAGGAYALTRTPAVPPVQVTAADAGSADRKAASLEAAAALAARTGRPVPVSVTFTDAELTALANQQLASSAKPFDSVILHSNPAGYVEGTANAHFAGQVLPVYFRAQLVTPGGHPQLSIIETRVGAVGVPGAVTDQLTRSLAGGVDLSSLTIQDAAVKYGAGEVTLTGTVLPPS